jgi:hypothetical protein
MEDDKCEKCDGTGAGNWCTPPEAAERGDCFPCEECYGTGSKKRAEEINNARKFDRDP